MILPFLPLLKMHVSTQSEEDIAKSLTSVNEFIRQVLIDGGRCLLCGNDLTEDCEEDCPAFTK